MIPIVFIVECSALCLKLARRQAEAVSPRQTVVIALGEKQIESGSHLVRASQLEDQDVAEFRRIYRHHSTNPESFERVCLERWFYLRNYLRRTGEEIAMHLDWDVLLYEAPDLLIPKLDQAGEWLFTLNANGPYPGQPGLLNASIHCSLWKLEGLERFCQFILEQYRSEKLMVRLEGLWNQVLQNGWAGGVSDMTMLSLFAEANPESYVEMGLPLDGAVYDLNVTAAENSPGIRYKMDGAVRKIEWENGAPWFVREDGSMRDRARSIHFQSVAKAHMAKHYRGSRRCFWRGVGMVRDARTLILRLTKP